MTAATCRAAGLAFFVLLRTVAHAQGEPLKPPAPGTVNYFSWGVETLKANYGTTPSPFNVEFRGATVQDCTVAHSGNCSMKLTVIGNDSGNQGLGADLIQQNPPYLFNLVGGQAVYYRWWMRIMPGFSWGSGTAKVKAARAISGVQGYTGYLMRYGFLLGECDTSGCLLNDGRSGGADCCLLVGYDFTKASDGIWHEYVVMVKPNSGATTMDGVLRAWVDTKLVGTYSGFLLHRNASDGYTEAWGGWMVYPYFQMNGRRSDGGTIYLDDFSTDNVWNSMLGPPK